jgi:DedD protein
MAFFKFRQRGQAQPEPAPTSARRARKDEAAAAGAQESIETVRRRARHRLLGAVVLVGIAVVGFPLLFDTQPRPIAVNAPIIIPDKDAAGPLRTSDASSNQSVPASASLDEREEVVTTAAASTAASRATSAASVAAIRSASGPSRTGSDQSAQRARQEATARSEVEARAKAKQESEARARREAEARAKREEESARVRRDQQSSSDAASADAERRANAEQEAKAKREADAKRDAEAKRQAQAKAKREAEAKAKREEAVRARALLEGRRGNEAQTDRQTADAAPKQRFIVQVGAFSDDAATRETRQKAEAAGVKTYTQVVETSAGKRTRVRVGPFASREEAEKAAAALKRAGLGGAILGL